MLQLQTVLGKIVQGQLEGAAESSAAAGVAGVAGVIGAPGQSGQVGQLGHAGHDGTAGCAQFDPKPVAMNTNTWLVTSDPARRIKQW